MAPTPERNFIYFYLEQLLCLPTAPGLPLWRNGDFGTSPLLLGSSRTSRCLPVSAHVGCRNALHNGGSRNYVLIRFDDGVVR
jgi:hypothetical protein